MTTDNVKHTKKALRGLAKISNTKIKFFVSRLQDSNFDVYYYVKASELVNIKSFAKLQAMYCETHNIPQEILKEDCA